MMRHGTFVHMEAFSNLASKVVPDLTLEVGNIRQANDYSVDAIEKCAIPGVVFAHTGIKINFYITKDIGYNGLFRLPFLDSNHPFFTSRNGIGAMYAGDTGVTLLESIKSPLEGTVDPKNYRVSGFFSELTVNIAIGYDLFKDSSFTDDEVAAIITHELGHAWDYFMLLGNIITDNWLISNAAKVAAGSTDPELKKKVLIRTKEQLGIDELNYAELLGASDQTRKDTVELVLVSNSLIKGSSQSTTPLYDARTVEQSADAFVAYHGGGRALASALVKLNRKSKNIEVINPIVYITGELLKVMFTMFMLYAAPISTIIWLVALVPGVKIYDTPKDRLVHLKGQCVLAFKNTDDPDEKKRLSEQISAIDASIAELTSRKTVYEMIYDTVTPLGRKRYDQEKHQEAIKSLLFNEMTHKLYKWSKEHE